ncbi:macrolide family glycosyltransferase [Streptomyces sp. NBC_01500]|uniref:macrolide family glycosyltransferase n=2 Tax=Streptomyces TaxID=1883 RepID=UPI002252CFE1|nr:macrolide family glycosyltransferase [Streptomyces sp. NBC_01500]MCX4547580.1 MGT family glycosyltransferase [Streptomyces sp. NBC_01500]
MSTPGPARTPQHVAIFMFPGYGHVHPTLEMSRCLVTMGHRVTYVLDEQHTAEVTATGAAIVPYRSRRGRIAQAATGEDIGALGLEFLRESKDVVLPLALDAFRDDVPDLVLYDLESFFAARIAARHWDRPTAQLFPYVATNEKFSLALEVFDGADGHVQQCIDLATEYLTGQGEDPDAVWTFMSNFDERNIVLLPREFQPLGETFDERYTFTGHSFPTDPPGTGSWPGPPGGGPAVLITLGTEVNERPDFFRLCDSAFADGGLHVVLPVGRGNLPAEPVAAHVETHEWIAFHTLVPQVEAVVCHGGMSTMLMAIHYGKPLVVVGFTPEEKLNGRRVAELGIGVSLSAEGLTADRLRAAVEQAMNDPAIQHRVARMRIDMLASGGPSRAAVLVEGWLRESTRARLSCRPHAATTGRPTTYGDPMRQSDRWAEPDRTVTP